jgi:hypothetical protein
MDAEGNVIKKKKKPKARRPRLKRYVSTMIYHGQ